MYCFSHPEILAIYGRMSDEGEGSDREEGVVLYTLCGVCLKDRDRRLFKHLKELQYVFPYTEYSYDPN
jgi:hypothetical protein